MKPDFLTSAQSATDVQPWLQYLFAGPELLKLHEAPFWLSELAHLAIGAQLSPSSEVSEKSHVCPGATVPRVRVVGVHAVTSDWHFEAAASLGQSYFWAPLPRSTEHVATAAPLEPLELEPLELDGPVLSPQATVERHATNVSAAKNFTASATFAQTSSMVKGAPTALGRSGALLSATATRPCSSSLPLVQLTIPPRPTPRDWPRL